jgi:serine-threonine kinase receptor-associated protein
MLTTAAAAAARFAAGGEDMWVHLHNADTGAELEVNKGHHGPVHTVR